MASPNSHPPFAGSRAKPRATYRLQFHREFPLRRAIELVPYLSELGISHLYASPLLKAQPGSTHGYDVCDCGQLNPELGTEADLTELVAELRRHQMGLILDIVPNHMGVGGAENKWWWDVLKHGPQSSYAGHFDIDWESPDPRQHGKVMLPVLGEAYQTILAQGELQLTRDQGEVQLAYHDHRFPIDPKSLNASDPSLTEQMERLNQSPDSLDALLRRQHYRLAWWRLGDTELNYRRFFNITTLAGVRVEDERVFQDCHQRILAWHQQGHLDGLRVDHPDGLRNPGAYFERLNQAAPGAWIVVEKIIEPGENLPESWPVAGTTGYDFLNRAGGVLIDPKGEKPLTDFYAEFTGEPTDCAAIVLDKKRNALGELLAAEVQWLTRLLREITVRNWRGRDLSETELRAAIVELAACFPVYRTYAPASAASTTEADATCLATAVSRAQQERPDLPPALFTLLHDLLGCRLPSEAETEFVMRFQQLTGPAMAKGVEDTTFYCFNRFVALNEVGGDPGHFGLSPEDFHQAGQKSQAQWPEAMLASSTHDTKRSEDVRARLSLLSEMPEAWRDAVRRWSVHNEQHRIHGFPDRNAEYLYYQTLVGAWPLTTDRAAAYMQKAACEAKQHTSWTQRDAKYDEALRHFVTATLADPEFVRPVESFVQPLIDPGYINSLAQTLIKLTAPGVPDTYQGTELWDFSLVDPDNRRPVDFAVRRQLLADLKTLEPETIWSRRAEGLPKLWLTRQAHLLRRQFPNCFNRDGHYTPLTAQGSRAAHVVAFLRKEQIATVAPRLILGLQNNWGDTTLELPSGEWRNVMTGQIHGGELLPLAQLMRQFPVALLTKLNPQTKR